MEFGSTWSVVYITDRRARSDSQRKWTPPLAPPGSTFGTPIAFLPGGHILLISNGQILELRREQQNWRSEPYLTPEQSS